MRVNGRLRESFRWNVPVLHYSPAQLAGMRARRTEQVGGCSESAKKPADGVRRRCEDGRTCLQVEQRNSGGQVATRQFARGHNCTVRPGRLELQFRLAELIRNKKCAACDPHTRTNYEQAITVRPLYLLWPVCNIVAGKRDSEQLTRRVSLAGLYNPKHDSNCF